MTLDLMPLSREDSAQVWRNFPGSPFQAVMHNELIDSIQADRSLMENCAPDKVTFLQARIAAHRELLGFIHRGDPTHKPN